ncbi:MAG: PRC-barrel domain-containing protein [Burkholderiaceae bacterium]
MSTAKVSLSSDSLISANRVTGTNVYNRAGEKLGSVEDVIIDKVGGRSVYAMMSFGGFLGMGEDYHPLPWQTLQYDTDKGGYVVDLAKEQLEGAAAQA